MANPSRTITVNVLVNANSSASIRMAGPTWDNWNPGAGPVATFISEFCFTFIIENVTADFEYKILLNGVQEDLVAFGKSTGDWTASPVTDYNNYANRKLIYDYWSDQTINIVYGMSGSIAHFTSLSPVNMTINVLVAGDSPESSVRLTGPGWDAWSQIAGPAATDLGYHRYRVVLSNVTTDVEYKVLLNGVQEDLLTFGRNSGDWSATPITDRNTYANRRLVYNGQDETVNIVFGMSGDGIRNVTYNSNGANGGTIPTISTSYLFNSFTLRTNIGNLTKKGFSFLGWNTQSNGMGTSYSEGQIIPVSGNITLYAAWNKLMYLPMSLKSLFTNNSNVYYKPGSLASCGVNTVRNSHAKRSKI